MKEEGQHEADLVMDGLMEGMDKGSRQAYRQNDVIRRKKCVYTAFHSFLMCITSFGHYSSSVSREVKVLGGCEA